MSAPQIVVMINDAEDPDERLSFVCPRKGCLSQEFWEVDRAERWNPVIFEGPDMLSISDGSGDFESTGYLRCQTCCRKCVMPEADDYFTFEWA